jgi:major membrane immunogen (membrane-anchored lipoprotein)
MIDKKYLLPLVISLLIIGCETQENQDVKDYTLEDSKEVAQLFILNSPTYASSGKNIQLVDEKSLRCDYCYVFIFSFEASGYGSAPEITTEQSWQQIMSVVVKQGKVVQANINNKWDEIKQKEIPIQDKDNIDLNPTIKVFHCLDSEQECSNKQNPVCGSNTQDYVNSCKACMKTKWYTKGICDLGYTQKAIEDLNKGKLNPENSLLYYVVTKD